MKLSLKLLFVSIFISGCSEDVFDQLDARIDSIQYKGWQNHLFLDEKNGMYFEYLCDPEHKTTAMLQRAKAAHQYYKEVDQTAGKDFEKQIEQTIENLSDEEDPSLIATAWKGIKAGNNYVEELEKAEKHIHKNYRCAYRESDTIMNTALDIDSNKLKQLLSNGLDINYQNEYGDTLLMSALAYENYAVAKWLISQGADIQLKNLVNDNALSNLVLSESLNHEMLDLLVSKGADINHQPDSNYSILTSLIHSHSATTNRLTDIELVLKKGANPNLLDSDGNLIASSICYKETTEDYQPLLELLLKYDLNLTLSDENGKTLSEQEDCAANKTLIAYLESKQSTH